MGDVRLDNMVNRDVGEDAITIGGKENREADAVMAGLKAPELGARDRRADFQFIVLQGA